ncbi:MAG: endonuclease III [Flavobacteriales bacterium]|nr:endonuclease III [Flavobacteriales bacterium]
MTIKERYRLFVEYFSKANPTAETELHYSNPFELLVAVILSAQCTDKRVNMVTKDFFRRFTNPTELAYADVEEVFEYIKSISYPNNKSKHLVGMAKILVDEFKSVVPANIDDLQKMPGVGRKTANVIASVVYQKPVMAVDTHVFRVAERLGLTTNAKTPLEAEKQLTKHLPEEVIHVAHHWLILHGRYVCVARKPKCGICEIKHFCKSYGKLR